MVGWLCHLEKGQEMGTPEIVVESDYDGYFAKVVDQLVATHARYDGAFNHSRIVVTAGPYRPYAVQFEKDGDTIRLDFYAAIRNGFGQLSGSDLRELARLL